jgi:hypothetical protein
MRALFGAALVLAVSSAWASNWVGISPVQDGNYQLDLESVRYTDKDHARMWARLLYVKPQRLELYGSPPKQYVKHLWFTEINCITDEVGVGEQNFYDANGKVVYQAPSGTFLTTHRAAPDTLDVLLINKICSREH